MSLAGTGLTWHPDATNLQQTSLLADFQIDQLGAAASLEFMLLSFVARKAAYGEVPALLFLQSRGRRLQLPG